MHKVQLLLGLALVALIASASTVSAQGPLVLTDNPNQPDSVVTTYNPEDGLVSVAGNNVAFTTWQLESPNGWFKVDGIDPTFDGLLGVITAPKLFALRTAAVSELAVGTVLEKNLTADALIAELVVDGSLSPSGRYTDAPGGGSYLYVVPEPSSILLSVFGLLGLVGLRRRK